MKTSVVIASYNGAKYIIQELETILKQSVEVDEVIIQDDGSSDQTIELISNFITENKLHHWKLICNEVNLGFSKNFISALQKATGDIIFFADQDDLWAKDKVEKTLECFKNNSNLKSVSSEFEFIDGQNQKIAAPQQIPNTHCVLDGNIRYVQKEENVISSFIRGCTMAITKDVANYVCDHHLESMASNSLLGHDWIIWTIASLMGDVVIINQPLIQYRFHESNTSLEAVRRKNLVGDVNKRLIGLEKSIEIHEYIKKHPNDFVNYDSRFNDLIQKCIMFEKKRLSYLKTGNVFTYLSLGFHLNKYQRYYRDFKRGIKVYLGDFLYRQKYIKCK